MGHTTSGLSGKAVIVTGAGRGIGESIARLVAMDMAHAMLYLASEGASYVTGQTIIVHGGAVLPENGALMA